MLFLSKNLLSLGEDILVVATIQLQMCPGLVWGSQLW